MIDFPHPPPKVVHMPVAISEMNVVSPLNYSQLSLNLGQTENISCVIIHLLLSFLRDQNHTMVSFSCA